MHQGREAYESALRPLQRISRALISGSTVHDRGVVVSDWTYANMVASTVSVVQLR